MVIYLLLEISIIFEESLINFLWTLSGTVSSLSSNHKETQSILFNVKKYLKILIAFFFFKCFVLGNLCVKQQCYQHFHKFFPYVCEYNSVFVSNDLHSTDYLSIRKFLSKDFTFRIELHRNPSVVFIK